MNIFLSSFPRWRESRGPGACLRLWIPAFAGMTMLLLTSCMTLTATSQDCMNAPKFTTGIACIDQKVTENRALRDDPLVQEYVLTGHSLARQVQSGKLSDADARLQLIKKLNEVRERDIAEQAAISETFSNHGPHTPSFTDCGRTPGVPSCLAY